VKLLQPTSALMLLFATQQINLTLIVNTPMFYILNVFVAPMQFNKSYNIK